MIFPLIQIAGVKDYIEAEMLIESGANSLGFPFGLNTKKEDLSLSEAASIIGKIRDVVDCCLITYLDKADYIIPLANYLNVSIIQLHGEIEIREIKKIKDLLPFVSIIKSIIVEGSDIIKAALSLSNYHNHVDAFLTDTYDKTTGAIGATGKIHDWNISRELVKLSKKPVILAGGLNAENVYSAIKFVQPLGVDAHTLLEDSSGRKSEILVKKFVTEANLAFRMFLN